MNSDTDRKCECGCAERWARDPHHPVQFNELSGGFEIAHGRDGRWRTPMHYCPVCGGRLPSNSEALFTTPDEVEMAEATALLRGVQSADEVLRRLGPPDQTIDWDPAFAGGSLGQHVLQWSRCLRFSRRWKTLSLDVLEFPDGSIKYFISGRYQGPGAE